MITSNLLILTFNLLITRISTQTFINYETYVKINKFNNVSNYAKSHGFIDFDLIFTDFKV